MIYLSIIEKDPSFQKMFADFFHTMGGYSIVAVYGHYEEMLVSPDKPKHLDIILLSLGNGEEDPVQIGPLKKHHANARIIISVASPGISLITECLKNRADGIVLKSEGLYALHAAINSSLNKGLWISPILNRKLVDSLFFHENAFPPVEFTQKEKNIIRLLNEGLSYKQMANKLGITAFTINHHLKKIYKKAGVNSRSQLAAILKKGKKGE